MDHYLLAPRASAQTAKGEIVTEFPLLNHQELVIRAGETEHARAFFETMGCLVTDLFDGQHLAIYINGEAGPTVDNVIYANEPTPAQAKFEAALEAAISSDAELDGMREAFRNIRWEWPQYVAHFGAAVPTHEDWLARAERMQEANRSHPLLKGRVNVKICEPGLRHALGPQSQAFIHTDILTTGVFAVAGVLFDLQWNPEIDLDNMDPIDFPDMATMV